MNSRQTSTKHTKESILESSLTDFKGIFSISEFFRHPLRPVTFKWAVGAWVLFSAATLILRVEVYDLIVDMVNNLIVWIPCILGFTIGGYSFLVGFVQSDLMQKISEPRKNSVFSLFQMASAAFACNIVLQAFSLVIAFLVHFVIYIDTKKQLTWHSPEWLISIINIFSFLIVGLSFAIALAVVVQLVVNVFNFSQLHHYNINKEKLDKKEKDQQPPPGPNKPSSE
jgi:hypothetical protein